MESEKHNGQALRPKGQLLPLAGALFFLLLALVSGGLSQAGEQALKRSTGFQQILRQKEEKAKEVLRQLEADFAGREALEVLNRQAALFQRLAEKQGIYFFYYQDGGLKYWSDHSIPVQARWGSRMGRPYMPMRNRDYVSVVQQTEVGTLLALIELRSHYPFQNKFLKNHWQRDFRLGKGVEIEFLEEQGSFPVLNSEGVYLFSLRFPRGGTQRGDLLLLSILSYLLALLFALVLLRRLLKKCRPRLRLLLMVLVSLIVVLLLWALQKMGFPELFSGLRICRPELYASRLFSSLGALGIFSGACLFLALLWYRFGLPLLPDHKKLKWIVAILLIVASSVLLLFVEGLIRALVLDSTISFEAHRVTTFSLYTLVGLLIISTWFFLLGLLSDAALILLPERRWRALILPFLVVSVVMGLAAFLPLKNASWLAWLMMLMFLGGIYYLRDLPDTRIPFSRYVFLLVCVSVFMTLRILDSNHTNTERKRMVALVKLSSEHDPVAEMLFSEMTMAVRNDSILSRLIDEEHIPIERINQVVERLRRSYFSGYWTKYDLQVTVCRPDDQLYLEPPGDEYLHCYSFFDEMIYSEGIQIAGSDFYFLDNQNGRISYLASIPFYGTCGEHRIYVELDSRIFSEELGYPELLLDNPGQIETAKGFCYAKYNHGDLLTRNGTFPYRRSSAFYTGGEKIFEALQEGGYEHSIYNVDEQNTLIVGSPVVTQVDKLISFSYIFALNFLFMSLVYLFINAGLFRRGFSRSFKTRIQYSMVGMLFLTFAMICGGTVYFIIKQNRAKDFDNLRNTMRSVYIELLHKLEYEEDLGNWSSESYYNLDELLRKFSNVFYTDINLYDKGGRLLATSRSEVFERQLLSRRMNRVVYDNLSKDGASEFIHSERIGELKYISAYMPLMNSDNHFLAYLNLPYFTQSDALTQNITNLVMAIINIYLILFLVILLVSVFLADRITQPLRLIQQKIARVSLSAKNEPIRYDRRDEIRGLVEEYNFMVAELERSAGLLARSERESAWREMARQIAHEIKNPLTPMKLNIQHLQRTLKDGTPEPGMVDRMAATLIEQIDSLSAIANEFSDFAQMPPARNQRIDVVAKLRNLVQLFGSSDRMRISLDLGGCEEVFVFADKEQLMRVFINLVKNGMQAIPEGRDGDIHIQLLRSDEQHLQLRFTDNGKGIPEEIRDKLFQPNFTTKSRGMGMGLAISHSIIGSFGGKIWYETQLDRGTTFFIELPVLVEKSGAQS